MRNLSIYLSTAICLVFCSTLLAETTEQKNFNLLQQKIIQVQQISQSQIKQVQTNLQHEIDSLNTALQNKIKLIQSQLQQQMQQLQGQLNKLGETAAHRAAEAKSQK
jgi:phosphopantetheine adenylyltransferase